jgi:hypothetical protein
MYIFLSVCVVKIFGGSGGTGKENRRLPLPQEARRLHLWGIAPAAFAMPGNFFVVVVKVSPCGFFPLDEKHFIKIQIKSNRKIKILII